MNQSQEKERTGGFDCVFVETIQKGFEPECPICMLILREPHQTSCCGHNYCKTCIKKSGDSVINKACPTCKKEKFTVFHNKGMERSLNGLEVRCVHEKSRCAWKGLLGEYTKHLNENPQQKEQLNGCGFTKVSCVYCNARFIRNDVCKHQVDECIKRPYGCKYCCHYKTDYDDVVNKHWDVCPLKPVPCPQKCGKTPLRQNVEAHVKDECPLTVVKCDFHYATCSVTKPRKDIPEHLTKELIPHLQMLAAKQKKYEINHEQHLKDLKRENKDLKQRLTELQQKQQSSEEKLKKELETISNKHRTDLKQADDRLTKETKTAEEKLRTDLKTLEGKLRSEIETTQKTLKKDASTGNEEIRKELRDSVKTLQKELSDATRKLERERATAIGGVTKQLKTLDEKLSKSIQDTLESLNRERNELENRLKVLVKGEKDRLKLEIKAVDTKLSAERTKLKDDTNKQVHELQARQKSVVPYFGMEPLKYVELTMNKYQEHLKSNEKWCSPPFYSHLHGQKLYLSVTIQPQSGNISVYVWLAQGEFSYIQQSIKKGEIKIVLVDQVGINHKEKLSPLSSRWFSDNVSDEMVWIKPQENFTRGDCLRFRVKSLTIQ